MNNNNPIKRTDISAKRAYWELAIILVVGFVLRVMITAETPMGINSFSDDNSYLISAATMMKTGYITYGSSPARAGVLGAGMPLLLGAFFSIFGYQPEGLMLSHIAFSVFGLLTAMVVFFLGEMLHSRRVGIIAAMLTALDVSLMSINSVFLTETPYMFFNFTAFYCFLRCARRWQFGIYLCGIFCFCGAASFKGIALIAPLMVSFFFLIYRIPVARWLPKAAVGALVFGMLFLPWCVRNQILIDTFSPFPLSQGDQKLLGTYEGWGVPSGTYAEDTTMLDAEAWEQGYQEDIIRRLNRRNELANQRLEQWIKERPIGMVLTHLLYKPFRLLTQTTYSSRILNIPIRATAVLWWGMLAGAAYGILKSSQVRNERGFFFPLLYIGITVFVTALYVPLGRYNMPNIPFVFFYTAVGVEESLTAIKRSLSKLLFHH